MSQDPGKFQHYWMVQGHGEGGRWCIVDWGYERVVPFHEGKATREPNDDDRVNTLNIIRDRANAGWQIDGTDRMMRPVMRGVDVGFEMKLILGWLSGEPDWKPMRGLRGRDHDESSHLRAEHQNDRMRMCDEIERTNSIQVFRPKGWRIYLYGLLGDAIRHNVHAGLLRKAGDPGSGVIPRDLKANDMLVLHLCGEVWRPARVENGKHIEGAWIHPHGGWDLLDCLRYAHALAMIHTYHPERFDDGATPPPRPLPAPDPIADGWIGDTHNWSLT